MRRNGHGVREEAEQPEEGHRPEDFIILCSQFVADTRVRVTLQGRAAHQYKEQRDQSARCW